MSDGATTGNDVRQLLPTVAYTSEDWFEREQRELFGRVWNFAGMAEDLADPGDYVCVQAGLEALIVVRGEDGQLRAFHNLCRHRGSRLLEGTGNAGSTIRCFYHSWTYELDGTLRGVPQESSQFPDLDKTQCGLLPAAVGQWKNLIFAHPEPGAEPLDEWLADFPERFGPHEPTELIEVANVRYRVGANWKIVIENYIDGYHFVYLHAESLGTGDFTRQEWHPAGRHWTFKRPLKDGVSLDGGRLPVIDRCGPTFGVDAHVLFPNLALYGTATSWLTFHVVPVSAALSFVDIRTRAMPAALARRGPARSPEIADEEAVVSANKHTVAAAPEVHPLQSNDVMAEDIYACEAVQKGMQSPRYQVGPMAHDYERALMWYQQNIIDFVPLS